MIVRSFFAAATFALAQSAYAEPSAGDYLAARQAGLNSDFTAAARYFRNALISDASNITLMEQTITSLLGAGEIDQAAILSRQYNLLGHNNQISNISILSQAARDGDWGVIFTMLEEGHEVGPLIDGLSQAWAYLGRGQMDRALESFDEVIDTQGLTSFGQYHKAMALAMVGDLEGADTILSLPPNQGVVPTRGSVIAHVQILAKMGEFDRASDLMNRVFLDSSEHEVSVINAALAAKEVPTAVAVVSSPSEGISDAFIGLSSILQGEANESYLLLYAQAARAITPQNANAHIATARLQVALEQFEEAAETFSAVSTDNVLFPTAEIGRAEALAQVGQFEKSIEVLTQLTRSHPNLYHVHASLGDSYRQKGYHDEAVEAYDTALNLASAEAPSRWWLLFARGISHEALDHWTLAESDFRAALSLNPDQPSVLNYLGYSLVDRGIEDRYDEALEMIERALAMQPDSGAITDSLAWAYFKLGRYVEAVDPMVRAAELEPNDPIVSDHLGDVYWMVGRKTEARFQWRRALSFNPEETDAIRIRRKLAVGLDSVWEEEGFIPPTQIDSNGR